MLRIHQEIGFGDDGGAFCLRTGHFAYMFNYIGYFSCADK
jgi:hypothetical protein